MVFRIDLKIFIFLIIFFITNQIEFYLIAIFFAIIHEVSHLMVGIFLKMKVKSVTLMPMGLSIQFYSNRNKNEKTKTKQIKRIIVAIAGPISNILIMFIIKFININNELAQNIIYANLFIAIFNLMPIYPLDGGQILKVILNILLNKRKANTYTNIISTITLFGITLIFSILIYYVQNIALMFIAIYLWYIMLQEARVNVQKRKMKNMLINLTK